MTETTTPAGQGVARSVVATIVAARQLEGAGFEVRRPFPSARLPMLDPFLLLDEMGPVELGPGEAKGAPDHPHRGFETVTYVLDGELEHEDSAGNRGRIGPGAVQWMTAGAGVIHSEMPVAQLRRDGGRLHGVQLWVNLPAADKLVPPRYQEIPAGKVPRVERPDGTAVRVVAGEVDGVRGAVETRTPVTYLHASVPAGARLELTLSRDQHAAVYHLGARPGRGGGFETDPDGGQLTIYGEDGDRLVIEPADDARELLVLAGVPLREPVARYGPFVMNTKDEIAQAISDFQEGRFAPIAR